jgi:hypothetical protein
VNNLRLWLGALDSGVCLPDVGVSVVKMAACQHAGIGPSCLGEQEGLVQALQMRKLFAFWAQGRKFRALISAWRGAAARGTACARCQFRPA